jgi:hypothetical protein
MLISLRLKEPLGAVAQPVKNRNKIVTITRTVI